jgi:hypothetical protein
MFVLVVDEVVSGLKNADISVIARGQPSQTLLSSLTRPTRSRLPKKLVSNFGS